MRLIKTLWGVPEASVRASWPAMFAKISADSFDGVEVCSPGPFYSFAGYDGELLQHLAANKLKMVMQIQTQNYPVGPGGWREHADDLRKKAESASKTFNDSLLFFNVHSGKDSFRRDDALRFFEAAAKVEADVGVKMVHETHRQRILHSPFVLRDLKDDLPASIRFNADLSHWVVALERCMDFDLDAEFWPQTLDFLTRRTDYIHARVATAQAIQAAHPLAPEFTAEREAFCHWWQLLAQGMQQRGVEITVCPEYGPPPYLPTLPFTRAPVADLDGVVKDAAVFMRQQCHNRLEGICFQR